MRCLLPILLQQAGSRQFAVTVWASLAEANYNRYVETFDGGGQGGFGPWFGWLSNSLPGFPETLNLKCHVHPRDDRQIPLLELEPGITRSRWPSARASTSPG